jgi:CRP/FNR family cyclic AMP-dependent transcriptional regulator
MDIGALGKNFNDGDTIIRQGETGDCMYVLQSGEVEVVKELDGKEHPLAVRRQGDFFGEMALFGREVRMATVRARGPVRVLTIDKKNLLRRIQEDPSLAFRIIETMSRRIRELSDEVAHLHERP